MRSFGVAVALAVTLTAGGVMAGAAVADEDTPTRQDVREARTAVQEQAGDVDAVRTQLVLANQRLQESAVAAAQAAEAYNGARWRAAEARRAAAEAQRRSAIAGADVRRLRHAYGDALVSSYELSPGLTALSAMVRSDGIGSVVEQTTTLRNAEGALEANYDSYRAAAVLADVATDQAEDAADDAVRAAQDARDAREAARAAADEAAADASAIAQEKDVLIARLAELQHISVGLAQQRQSALEEQAAAAAAAAAQQEQEAQEQHAAAAAAPDPTPDPAPEPEPTPAPASTPSAPPAPPAPPAPSAGASGAIAFARQQVGEPYRWGAAGPGAWDCSGLTMGAWAAGGRSLPHYSVAQYEQSTPVSAGQLQPGDLVFWGSSSDAGSIYHVALYAGNGMIIHAPRTGRPVTEESLYYWIPPNFYARP